MCAIYKSFSKYIEINFNVKIPYLTIIFVGIFFQYFYLSRLIIDYVSVIMSSSNCIITVMIKVIY